MRCVTHHRQPHASRWYLHRAGTLKRDCEIQAGRETSNSAYMLPVDIPKKPTLDLLNVPMVSPYKQHAHHISRRLLEHSCCTGPSPAPAVPVPSLLRRALLILMRLDESIHRLGVGYILLLWKSLIFTISSMSHSNLFSIFTSQGHMISLRSYVNN